MFEFFAGIIVGAAIILINLDYATDDLIKARKEEKKRTAKKNNNTSCPINGIN